MLFSKQNMAALFNSFILYIVSGILAHYIIPNDYPFRLIATLNGLYFGSILPKQKSFLDILVICILNAVLTCLGGECLLHLIFN